MSSFITGLCICGMSTILLFFIQNSAAAENHTLTSNLIDSRLGLISILCFYCDWIEWSSCGRALDRQLMVFSETS